MGEKYGILNLMDIPLRKGKNVYIVEELVKIRQNNLIVAKDDLDLFIKIHGIMLESPLPTKPVNSSEAAEIKQDKKLNCNLPPRNSIKSRNKAPINMIIEHVFNKYRESNPSALTAGNWKLLYNLIKKEASDESEELLPSGESVAYYIQSVNTSNNNPGIVMKEKIEGRKESDPGRFKYSKASLSSIVSRIRSDQQK